MKKLCIGVPLWGKQDVAFWKSLALEAAYLYKKGIDLVDILDSKSMSTDNNRNEIVKDFKATGADWLFWWDTDNSQPPGSIARLMEQNKQMVGGIYFRRSFDQPTPIAYTRQEDGLYRTIKPYTRGEILPVDASGMNCMLIHRSVFDEIEKNYELLLDQDGRRLAIHREDIQGDIFDDAVDPSDGLVVNGQLRKRVTKLPYDPKKPPVFPFFRQEYNRSEDYPFYEAVRRVGIQIWIDTSIECSHWLDASVDGSHFREWVRQNKLRERMETGG